VQNVDGNGNPISDEHWIPYHHVITTTELSLSDHGDAAQAERLYLRGRWDGIRNGGGWLTLTEARTRQSEKDLPWFNHYKRGFKAGNAKRLSMTEKDFEDYFEGLDANGLPPTVPYPRKGRQESELTAVEKANPRFMEGFRDGRWAMEDTPAVKVNDSAQPEYELRATKPVPAAKVKDTKQPEWGTPEIDLPF
jgi:hypothetical protein